MSQYQIVESTDHIESKTTEEGLEVTISHARHSGLVVKGVVIVLVAIPISIVLWIVIMNILLSVNVLPKSAREMAIPLMVLLFVTTSWIFVRRVNRYKFDTILFTPEVLVHKRSGKGVARETMAVDWQRYVGTVTAKTAMQMDTRIRQAEEEADSSGNTIEISAGSVPVFKITRLSNRQREYLIDLIERWYEDPQAVLNEAA